ncbi:MAG: hypothetical protein AAGC93_24365 [Cyanobacteria bacterium P01_F01_bin.53]
MRNASHNRAQAKVAVISAKASAEEAQRRQLQEQIAIALVGLGALVAAGTL